MALRHDNISLDHLTNLLIYLSTASSPWFSLNFSYKHDFHLLLEFTSSKPLTLDGEVCMQEEWHRNKRKCTFVLLTCNLLLLDLDIGDNDQPCIAVALLLYIPLPLHSPCTANCHCLCTVNHRCCHHRPITPSIAVAIAPTIACRHCAVRCHHPATTAMLS